MNKQTVHGAHSTWTLVEEIAPHASALFYRHLFEADPPLTSPLKGNMKEQGKHLRQMSGAAVEKLPDLKTLIPLWQNLARRHVSYGVQAAHYGTVGAALLQALKQGLGTAFTSQVENVWADVIDFRIKVLNLERFAVVLTKGVPPSTGSG